MTRKFSKKDKRCWIVFGYAPEGTSNRKAILEFNEFIANPKRGLVLFHDHFIDNPGGIAIFSVESSEELKSLKEYGLLKGWDLKLHPLIYSENSVGFLYQTDFTMTVYSNKRLKNLMAEYETSELSQDVDQQVSRAS